MKVLVLLLFILNLSAFSQPKESPKDERCVVCGIDVNIDSKLTSLVKLKDGSYKYAESPKHIINLSMYLVEKDTT
ncbi:MAG: hypothetical protein QW794_06525 [Thermosphaera sp.]